MGCKSSIHLNKRISRSKTYLSNVSKQSITSLHKLEEDDGLIAIRNTGFQNYYCDYHN